VTGKKDPGRSSRIKATRSGDSQYKREEYSSGSDSESTETEIDPRDVRETWSTENNSGFELIPKDTNMSLQDRETEGRSSKDSGRGDTPNPGLAECMQRFLIESRKRDEDARQR